MTGGNGGNSNINASQLSQSMQNLLAPRPSAGSGNSSGGAQHIDNATYGQGGQQLVQTVVTTLQTVVNGGSSSSGGSSGSGGGSGSGYMPFMMRNSAYMPMPQRQSDLYIGASSMQRTYDMHRL